MKKRSLIPLGFLIFAVSATAEVRTFTSPDGRTLDAEVSSATLDTVTLKLAAGGTIVAPISKFSTADQQFIKEWRKQNPTAIKYSFTSSYTKEKTKSQKSSVGAATVTSDSWICNMKIANRSGQTLEKLKIDYDIFYDNNEGGRVVTRKASGSATIDNIKHLQEVLVPTKELTLQTSQLKGGYYYSDGARARQRDSLSGMVIKISHEGKQVYTWASSGVPEGRAGVSSDSDSANRK
jgi:hypothetical protein